MEAHTASDDPTRYRGDDELVHWRARDPIARFETYLRNHHDLDDATIAELHAEADGVAARIRSWAGEELDLDPSSMFTHVYASLPPALAHQRQRLAGELARRQDRA